jgi:hypothetical protein
MGKPAAIDRPYLPSLSHPFTLDTVICCQYEGDAQRIVKALKCRLAKYHLELNEEKTRLVPFETRLPAWQQARCLRVPGIYILLGKIPPGSRDPKG